VPGPARGLYELLVTEALAARLSELSDGYAHDETSLRSAEAPDRIALHLSQVVQRALESFPDESRVAAALALARELLERIDASVPAAEAAGAVPLPAGRVLRLVAARHPDGQPETIPAPLIPLLDTTLLTNAPGEPRVGHQLATEIVSADRIDVVMAFVRRSGLAPLIEPLRRHREAGRRLRLLTTTYTGSTEAAALEMLRRIGADVRVSYDVDSTRLHAKAWLFHRESGFSTAYIGSSNLTQTAQTTGLEWNVRLSEARNRDVVRKMSAVFESYWNSGDFVPFDPDEFRSRAQVEPFAPAILLSPIEVRLEPFQERLLEQIALARQRGHHRNLLAAATGTGKTVMAAVDYARLRTQLPRSRLLFVAHREEILDQSLATFRHCLREPAFGERWVAGDRPARFENVFASIQSLSASRVDRIEPAHFDVVVIDEFHHAAAPSYRALLERVEPRELLGLTATPERSDGLPILEWFDGRIAAELRLWDAIDQHRLSPFAYYGVHDGLDLRQVPWVRGRGYDVDGLSNLFMATDAWARRVISELIRRVDDVSRMRALGFCVSVAHARFMSRVFKEAGIRATAVWADSPEDERRAALADLAATRTNVVFSVDLFNEGVDVPAVDTLLLLRPTDSPTLFLQQLGRGLRRHAGKAVCTVLDFVGRHRREFRFDRRFRALLGGSRQEVTRHVQAGFPFLPAGCHMELDPVASEIVLQSIREAVPSGWTAKVEELRQIARQHPAITLAGYLDATGLELEDVYSGNRSWSDLRAEGGLAVAAPGPHEVALRRACGRLLHVDDAARIEAYRRLLSTSGRPQVSALSTRDQRLLRMLVSAVGDQVLERETSLADAASLLWEHPQVRSELLELLEVLEGRIEHAPEPLRTHPDVPLQVHARYSRIEILAAFGVGTTAKVAAWQTGVYWAEEARADLLAFTLDKTSGQFSPTTRYRDYAISRDLIHWQSQSVTRADSETGVRYQHHRRQGSSVMLFARLRTTDRAFSFLGPADYLQHEGELPMSITWRLHYPLPGDLFAAFAAAVA
jgi:superfamily II DNA or RNA helicase/HKD family nuclease